jgi:hypothetical protein
MTMPRRRPLALALAVTALALLGGGEGGPAPAGALAGGNVGRCTQLSGDAARACYRREVGADLAALSGGRRPAGKPTFVSTEDRSVAFVCDLHARIGVAVGQSSDFTDAWRPLQ